MSGISLTNPVSRGSDTGFDVSFIGVNYDGSKVIVRCTYTPSGLTRDLVFEGAALVALRQGVAQFGGLRVAILQYIQGLDATLSGSVT